MEKIEKGLTNQLENSVNTDLTEITNTLLNISRGDKFSVLGFDILGYSQMTEPNQTLLPFLFKLILKKTESDLKIYEPCLFIDILSFKENIRFIDSGDGGYFILNTPLHSVIFALYMESVLRDYNSNLLWTNLKDLIGPIKIRYSISYDFVFQYEDIDNYYGTAIINCARILAKDKLDRCLIDENSYIWFLNNIHGIESLKVLELQSLKFLKDFRNPNTDENVIFKSFSIPEKRTYDTPGIDNVFILKVGNIRSKDTILSIYSIHLQMSYKYQEMEDKNKNEWKSITVSLGNLNSAGLE